MSALDRVPLYVCKGTTSDSVTALQWVCVWVEVDFINVVSFVVSSYTVIKSHTECGVISYSTEFVFCLIHLKYALYSFFQTNLIKLFPISTTS